MGMRLLPIFILTSAFGFAQGEFMNNSNAIPPMNSGIEKSSSPSVFTPNVYAPSKAATSSKPIDDKPIEFTQNNNFENPGTRITDKLNKREGGQDSRMFRKNQYLGDFKSKADAVKIVYRDFGDVDGDEIKVLVNDHVVASRIFLEGEYKSLDLALQKGFNKIDFEALNQGLFGPNTAQFQVYDDKGQLISANQWNLATGFKATIIIVKE